MKKITKTTLRKWEACTEGYKRFCEPFPSGAVLSIASDGLIKDGHKDWSDWLWLKCKVDDDYADQTVVTGGDRATVTGGYCAMLVLKHYSSDKGRYFVRSANVGENGIKANTPYKLSEDGMTFVEVKK